MNIKFLPIMGLAALLSLQSLSAAAPSAKGDLGAAEIENLVRRSYQYVAMYNLIHKFAHQLGNRSNVCVADTKLKDHTLRVIARPNGELFRA